MKAGIDNRTDEELVRAYRDQTDREALGILYRRYAHLILGLCLNYLKNKEDARDAVMDIFEKASKKLPHQEIKAFKPWIYFVSRNHCIDLLRRKVEASPREFTEEIFMESDSDVRLLNEQRMEWLSEAVAALKAHQQQCIVLFYLKGKSYEEVAKATGFTEKEVKSYLQNGRRNLKNILQNLEHEQAE